MTPDQNIMARVRTTPGQWDTVPITISDRGLRAVRLTIRAPRGDIDIELRNGRAYQLANHLCDARDNM